MINLKLLCCYYSAAAINIPTQKLSLQEIRNHQIIQLQEMPLLHRDFLWCGITNILCILLSVADKKVQSFTICIKWGGTNGMKINICEQFYAMFSSYSLLLRSHAYKKMGRNYFKIMWNNVTEL